MISKAGIYQLTNAEYHAGPGVSSTHIQHLAKSPAHYKAWLDTGTKQTDEMRLGSAAHSFVLEPHDFLNSFAVSAKFDKRTTIGKEGWKEFSEANIGKTIINEEQFEVVKRIAEKINARIALDPDLRELLIGLKEQSFFWRDPKTGILCRCRPDVLTEVGFITDLKTTDDASEHGFQHSIAKYHYYIQAAFYLDGVRYAVEQAGLQHLVPKIPEYVAFIAAETSEPHEVKAYMLDESAISEGRMRYQAALEKLKPCLATQQWPGYDMTLTRISLPNWHAYTR